MTTVPKEPADQPTDQPAMVSMPATDPAPVLPSAQARNPLHGLTLEDIVSALVAHYGWPGLAERIPVRCFSSEPSVASSLKFLRKTPWARDKVEGLYQFMLRELRRQNQQNQQNQRSGQPDLQRNAPDGA